MNQEITLYSQQQTPLRDSVHLASRIVAIPHGKVPEAIRSMIQKRKLYRTVVALNELLDDPRHNDIAAKALAKIGLEHGG
jgi:hypothetical protein